MKGPAHYHSLPAQDNLVLKRAQSVNKLVSEVRVGDSGHWGDPRVKNATDCGLCAIRHYQFPWNECAVKSNSQESPESNNLNLKLSVSKGSKVSSLIPIGL